MIRPRVNLSVLNPAQNPQNQIQGSGPTATLPFSATNAAAQNPISTNPIFRRPIWTYVGVNQAPRSGPQPRLAQGTGPTGGASLPGNAPQLPGYLTDNEYLPTLYSYQPGNRQDNHIPIPQSIGTGTNGRDLVGTYQPHDFTPAFRFFHQGRQAQNWQTMVYPPNVRNLLQWQQAQRYRIRSLTMSARPLDSSQYFLGYQINPQVGSQIGQNSLGYMGSM